MSDQRLRDLEQRWRSTGLLADEVVFLLERVRVGALDPTKLRLAALIGHEACAVAAGDVTPYDQRCLYKLDLDDETLARLAHASCLISLIDDGYPEDIRIRLRASVDACERFIAVGERVSPDDPHFYAAVPSSGHALGSLQTAHDLFGVLEAYRRLGPWLVPWLLGGGDPIRTRATHGGQTESL